MGNELAGLDPATGALLWRFPHATDYGFNCSTPVFDGVDTLVCTSAYGNWAEAIRLVPGEDGIAVEKRWESRRLRVHFTNVVLVDGRLYGISGMTRPGILTCLDLATGEALWRSRGFAKGNLVYAGPSGDGGRGTFLILDEDGQLALAHFADDGLEIAGRVDVADSHAFAAPTLVGTDLYVRNRQDLFAFDLSVAGVAAVAEGRGRTLNRAPPELPEGIEDLVGGYETENPVDGDPLRLALESGRLTLETPEGTYLLGRKPGTELYELVEERTSGSAPRTIEFLADEVGNVYRFTLRSPRHGPLVYWLVE